MRQHALTFIAFALLLVLNSVAIAQEAQRVGFAEEVSVTTKDFALDEGQALRWSITRGVLKGYIRLEISDLEIPSGASLIISDRYGEVVQELRGPLSRKERFYSDVIFGDQAEISIYNASAATFKIALPRVYYEYTFTAQNSIYEHDDRVQINSASLPGDIKAIARSVVFISFVVEGNYKVCTGFYIGNGNFLTNHHCIRDQEICDTAVIVTDYSLDEFLMVKHGAQFGCKTVSVPDDTSLDYVTFTVSGDLPTIPALSFLETDVPDRTSAVLLQHPGGEPKQAVTTGCSVLETGVIGRQEGSDFTHRCDTLGGSSGSPVLVPVKSKDGETSLCIVGLHHYGFMDAGDFSTFNRAVRSPLITENLKQRHIAFQTCES